MDHLFITYIIKSKTDSASARIERLLQVLGAASFNLYYMKGQDVILSDFLSRISMDKSNTHDIIPISFDLQEVLHGKYYVHTKASAVKSSLPVGKAQGLDKTSIPHRKPDLATNVKPKNTM